MEIRIDEVPITELKPHPINEKIYGNEDISGLVDQIKSSNWIKPLVVNSENKQINSGHRRWRAAQRLGLNTVPVEWRKFEDENEELRFLLLENGNRDKTPEQRVREAEIWEEIERKDAQKRQMIAAERTNVALGRKTNRETLQENFPEASHGQSRDKVAGHVGFGSGKTYQKAATVVKTADKMKEEGKTKEAEKLIHLLNHQSVTAAHNQVKKLENLKTRNHLAKNASAKISENDRIRIYHADFREGIQKIPDESIDFIFTDPPYDKETIPLYGEMASHAARVLKPGASLIAYVGHHALPEILPLMSQHLRYWWLCAVQHTGQNARQHGWQVFVGWKPLVWFVKGTKQDRVYVRDFVRSEPDTKEAHDWQQSSIEALYYIEQLTVANELILDPFAGSGTTLLAANHLNRRAIGFEIDQDKFLVAKGRLNNGNAR